MFEATDEGRAHLAENEAEVDELIERLEGHGKKPRHGQRPEIGRAIGNLMTALRNRVAHDGWNEAVARGSDRHPRRRRPAHRAGEVGREGGAKAIAPPPLGEVAAAGDGGVLAGCSAPSAPALTPPPRGEGLSTPATTCSRTARPSARRRSITRV